MRLYYILCLERTRFGREPDAFWWKSNGVGYTNVIKHAGLYSEKEAFEICKNSHYEDLPVPVEAFDD